MYLERPQMLASPTVRFAQSGTGGVRLFVLAYGRYGVRDRDRRGCAAGRRWTATAQENALTIGFWALPRLWSKARHFRHVTAAQSSVAIPSISARCAASLSRGLHKTMPS